MNEIWKTIFDGSYEVSSQGNLRRATAGRRTFAGRALNPIAQKNGYFSVRPVLSGKNVQCYVHELVAMAFLGPRTGERVFVNHIDGNKRAHAARTGLSARGERHGGSKLTEDSVSEIRRMRRAGASLPDICSRFGIARSTASQIATGQRWRHVG